VPRAQNPACFGVAHWPRDLPKKLGVTSFHPKGDHNGIPSSSVFCRLRSRIDTQADENRLTYSEHALASWKLGQTCWPMSFRQMGAGQTACQDEPWEFVIGPQPTGPARAGPKAPTHRPGIAQSGTRRRKTSGHGRQSRSFTAIFAGGRHSPLPGEPEARLIRVADCPELGDHAWIGRWVTSDGHHAPRRPDGQGPAWRSIMETARGF